MNDTETFADVLEANARYASGFSLTGLEPSAARGLAVVTCIDSRIEPLPMLGLRPGDAKILRNAGGRVTKDVLRSLVLATHLLGVERVMVVAHTKCRMTSNDEEMRRAIAAAGGPELDGIELLAAPDQLEALRADVDGLRRSELLGPVDVGGFRYDVDTGAVERIC